MLVKPIPGNPPAAGKSAPGPQREISSRDLFGERHEILIRHADSVYTLRRTRKGKLILTK